MAEGGTSYCDEIPLIVAFQCQVRTEHFNLKNNGHHIGEDNIGGSH